ncbi:isochorismatase family cysteine hydrolase [Lactobacillus xylocopicola]|uniref:Isochorismatase-like domain-containing protein n=1 Tax=Lactobacillus xylocopicola TaxID=2976676 RepID=A0ABN6SLH2_9LACO|nr:isochorismatase family cysteine hydrolase [Lactobacillus xylocopicola]BDR61208.1 hypothetical protein KIM322_14690 [Lactobacillus xylocopicola]
MVNNLLLCIDIQDQTMLLLAGKAAFLKRVNRIINAFRQANQPIIYVCQAHRGHLYKGLIIEDDAPIYTKQHPSAFTNIELARRIQEEQPQNIVVVGLMSQACVQATCKAAVQRKYSVVLVSDAHDSVIKPFRQYYNWRLTKLGIRCITTEVLLQEL